MKNNQQNAYANARGAYGQGNSAQNISPLAYQNVNAFASFSFTAGRAIRRQFRNFLEAKQFEGAAIAWLEQKSFFESNFIVRGPPTAVDAIKAVVVANIKRLNEE